MTPAPGTSESATGALASDLRVVVGQLIRRLRSKHRFSISQAAVLGRLDRHGPCPIHRRTFAGVWRQGELFVLEEDD